MLDGNMPNKSVLSTTVGISRSSLTRTDSTFAATMWTSEFRLQQILKCDTRVNGGSTRYNDQPIIEEFLV